MMRTERHKYAVGSTAPGALQIHASFRLRPDKKAQAAVQTLDGSVQGLDVTSGSHG